MTDMDERKASVLRAIVEQYVETAQPVGSQTVTNTAGLGGTNVTFALTDDPVAAAFSVEYTTNLVDWYFLGPAAPRYLFTDTNAPALPQRHYRLRWP